MSEEKKYVYMRSSPGEEPVRVEKYEHELTQANKDLFLGDLINSWEKAPEECQDKFIEYLWGRKK